jgi:hypothetical protein
VYCYVRQNPWTAFDPRGLTADEMEVEQHEDETIGVYYRDNPRLGTGRSKTRERVGTLMADGFVDLGNGRKTSMAAIRDEIDSGGTDISKFRSDKSRTLSIDGENDGFGGAILGVDARTFEGVYGPEQFDQDRNLLHAAKQLSEVAVAQYIPGLAVAPALARELQFANAVRVLARTERGAAAANSAPRLGTLKQVGPGVWESSGGLRYGADPNHGNRVQHVLRHSVDDPMRAGANGHGVFDAGRTGTLGVIDEAWQIAQRGGSNVTVTTKGTRTVYNVDMGRRVGYTGGQAGAAAGHPAANNVCIVVEGTNDLITAFPFR